MQYLLRFRICFVPFHYCCFTPTQQFFIYYCENKYEMMIFYYLDKKRDRQWNNIKHIPTKCSICNEKQNLVIIMKWDETNAKTKQILHTGDYFVLFWSKVHILIHVYPFFCLGSKISSSHTCSRNNR
jgi:hypothetical protein